jgi:hypothetical protein
MAGGLKWSTEWVPPDGRRGEALIDRLCYAGADEEVAVMLRINSIVSLVALALLFAVSGQSASDFSGTWKMDAARSESAHQAVPIGPVTLVIKQTATELSIETRRGEPDKSATRVETLTYKLDGSESTTTVTGGLPVTCSAHWEGAKLITGTTRNIQGATVTTTHVHSLNPNGDEITVRKTLTVQHGYQFEGAKNQGTGTDVFIKTKAATAK